ncbi:HNH endonuclease [Bradyrhizobium sp. WSM1417]|uniref:HNH endonuclease n=1 Tax=Bradyrhizobium sp. WSM1417 TaxID=754500 RepID=UPI000A02EAF0|nr:HNH endonuclease [Bradyrhizobium sp. WSM1417]
MRQIIKVRGRRCEDPQHDIAKPRDGIRLYGDHIIELADRGPKLDPSNVLLRCGPCHGRKTAEARAARAQGRGGPSISGA